MSSFDPALQTYKYNQESNNKRYDLNKAQNISVYPSFCQIFCQMTSFQVFVYLQFIFWSAMIVTKYSFCTFSVNSRFWRGAWVGTHVSGGELGWVLFLDARTHGEGWRSPLGLTTVAHRVLTRAGRL